MALHCRVQMADEGIVGEDDGKSAWYKTDVILSVAGRILRAYVLTDGYSGNQTLRLMRDDVGLDHNVARALMLRAYNISSSAMQWCGSDLGEAFFDLEKLIAEQFYRVDAQRLIRRIQGVSRPVTRANCNIKGDV